MGKADEDPQLSDSEPEAMLASVLADEGVCPMDEDQLAAAHYSCGGVRTDEGAREYWIALPQPAREALLFNYKEMHRLQGDERKMEERLSQRSRRKKGAFFPVRARISIHSKTELARKYQAYLESKAGDPSRKKKRLHDFCRETFGETSAKVKMRVLRANEVLQDPVYEHELKGRKDSQRYRRMSAAGRPLIEPQLGIRLHDWWIDYRNLTRGRISCSTILRQASKLLGDYAAEQAQLGGTFIPPKLSVRWVQRWRQRHGLSLRKPNRRFKVGHLQLVSRLKLFWKTLFRV